jgi:hypothetical protein
MSIMASLSDMLPLTVPVLDASGSNWAICVFHFQDAIEAKDFWNHFDGSASHPIAANATPTAMETAAIRECHGYEKPMGKCHGLPWGMGTGS